MFHVEQFSSPAKWQRCFDWRALIAVDTELFHVEHSLTIAPVNPAE
jgi:hypothetical protein